MRNKKLTLIELIITILVLGLLMGLAILQFTGVKANADVASFKNDIDVLTKAIDESYVKEDSLPLGEKVSITDPALLDVIYASGDSATDLYKVNLSKTGKYHFDLKTKVSDTDYFVYSKETGKVFYTKGQIDGNSKTLYTLEYVGLTGAKLGADPLINGMSVPSIETNQKITGNVPVSSSVEVKVNGTDLSVTVEDVVFEGDIDLMAAVKTKTFTSEVVLSTGMNIITIKVDSQITNFKINLENQLPEAPVIKPVAVITLTPEENLNILSNITWGFDSSTAAIGRTITAAEWEGNQSNYPISGSYTVRLRVQDSAGIWSDWVEKEIEVVSVFIPFKPINLGSTENTLITVDATQFFDVKIDSENRIHYYKSETNGIDVTVYKKVFDLNGNIIVPLKNLGTVKNHNWDENLQSFDVVLDNEGNTYLSSKGISYTMVVKKFDFDGNLIKTKTITGGSLYDKNGTSVDFYNDSIWVFHVLNKYPVIQQFDKELNLIKTISLKYGVSTTTPITSNGVEFDLKIKNDKFYTLITLPGSNSMCRKLQFGVFDSQGKKLNLTQIGGTNDYRYVGNIATDSLDNMYIIENGKINTGVTSHIYPINETTNAVSSGPTIRTTPFLSSVRTFTHEGKIYIVYKNGTKMVYRLFE